jgi:hypothetical protein
MKSRPLSILSIGSYLLAVAGEFAEWSRKSMKSK